MARKDKPTGKEIAKKAKSTKFASGNSATATKGGKRVTATPADLSHVKGEELEQGQVIGLLETEVDKETAGLPPGRYHVFMAKVGDRWQVLAESGGVVAAEAQDVEFERLPPGRKPDKPKIKFGSLWVRFCICIDDWCWCATYRFFR